MEDALTAVHGATALKDVRALFPMRTSTHHAPSHNLLLICGPIVSGGSQVGSKLDWADMVKMQQMVRVTCLEVLGAAPTQIEDYRREVVELQRVIQAFRDDVQQLRSQQGSSAASDTDCPASPVTPQASATGNSLSLLAAFDVHPKTTWFENRPLPSFSVRLMMPTGELYPHDDVALVASMQNGRGVTEERKANGQGELLAGERQAPVSGGVAEWSNLKICEPSSRHYGRKEPRELKPQAADPRSNSHPTGKRSGLIQCSGPCAIVSGFSSPPRLHPQGWACPNCSRSR
jgi:hypothetical protein